MKETVLDVLMYLFEHYFEDEREVEADRDSLQQELIQVGFPELEVTKAFSWLEVLTGEPDQEVSAPAVGTSATRVYTAEETRRLDLECRSFLLFLEQAGVLDGVTRELVIDRVMALEVEDLDLEQLKWVILMVLFNQPGRESVYAWMEDFVFDRASGHLH